MIKISGFEPLLPAEEKFLLACQNERIAEIGKERPKIADIEKEIRAQFLRYVIRFGREGKFVHETGVLIHGAIIKGRLDLDNIKINFPIWLDKCLILSENGKDLESLTLMDARIEGLLSLDGTILDELWADRLHATSNVFLRDGFSAKQMVALRGAEIGGQFSCRKAEFNGVEVSLNFDGAIVKANVSLINCKAKGEISFLDAEIGGGLSCSSAILGGESIGMKFNGAVIRGDVSFNRCISRGEIRFRHANIGGRLSCWKAKFAGKGRALSFDGAVIGADISLASCVAMGEVRFPNVKSGGDIICNKAKFNGSEASLKFSKIQIVGNISLEDCTAEGEVQFRDAKIGGGLSCKKSKFNANGISLNFDRAIIAGYASLDECTAKSEVRFHGAEIGGVSCKRANFNGSKISLSFDSSIIKGNVNLRECVAMGRVNIFEVEIFKSLDLRESNIFQALGLANANIKHRLILRDLKTPLSGSNFRHAQCQVLWDDVLAWGGGNHLNGFVYHNLDQQELVDPQSRIDWLSKQSQDNDNYHPQPWRHLQRTLRAMGHDTEARAIGIAHQKKRRQCGVIGKARVGQGRFGKNMASLIGALHDTYGFLTAYGYEPIRLLYAMISVWLFCALVYWSAALGGMMGPTAPAVFQNPHYASCAANGREWVPNIFVKRIDHNWYFCENLPDNYTTFSPLMYSLDLLLPFVDLFQEHDWGVQIPTPKDDFFAEYAEGSSQYFIRLVVWLEVIFGWMASLMLVAVISSMARNTRDDE